MTQRELVIRWEKNARIGGGWTFARSHEVEKMRRWDLINVIFPMAFKVTLVGECGLTFSAQSEMLVPGKNMSWHERDQICQTGEGGGGHRKISGLVDTREKPNRSKEKWM